METPIGELEHEHVIIKEGLNALELLNKTGVKKIQLSDVKGLLDFFKEFADECHHAKEEKLLFPIAEKRGIKKEKGPIAIMLAEHEAGRRLRKAMLETTVNWAKEAGKFKEIANNFLILLRAHIEKEDDQFFPMIDSVLTDQDRKELLEGFEKVEEKTGEGVHKKYHKLIKSLTEKYKLS